MPRFSVVVPCYRITRHRALVAQCLASLDAQDCGDFELLLVDDGSPDDTPATLEQLLAGLPELAKRSRVISLSRNGGVCAARNAGIDSSKGDFVAFLDYDDLWQPNYLSRMQQATQAQPGCPVFLARTDFMRQLGGHLRVGQPGSLAHLNALDFAGFAAWHLLHNFPVAMGSAVVVARRLFEEHPEFRFDMALTRTTAEDVLFGFLLLAQGVRPWYVDEPLCVHRRDFEMVSRSTAAFFRVDERTVNDYIACRATHALTRSVLAERPELARPLSERRRQLDLEFNLKREHRDPRAGFGLPRCLVHPRGFKTWLRLLLTRMMLGGPLEPLLQRYYFSRGGDDLEALQRVQTLRLTVGCLARE